VGAPFSITPQPYSNQTVTGQCGRNKSTNRDTRYCSATSGTVLSTGANRTPRTKSSRTSALFRRFRKGRIGSDSNVTRCCPIPGPDGVRTCCHLVGVHHSGRSSVRWMQWSYRVIAVFLGVRSPARSEHEDQSRCAGRRVFTS